MPLADLNLIHDARRGKKSNWVYREMNGKVFFSRRPNPKKQTEAQKATRQNFRIAMLYAKAVLADPAKRAPCEARAKKEGRPVRQLVISEMMKERAEKRKPKG
jgi:hypothetical protein